MADDLKFLTDSPSNLTHLDISGVGLGIGAADLAAHLLCHPVQYQNVMKKRFCTVQTTYAGCGLC